MFMRKTHGTTAWYDHLKREARHTAASHVIVQRCVSCVCFIVRRFCQIDSCRRLFAIIIYHTLCVLCMLCLSIVDRFCQIDGWRRLFAIIIYHTFCVLCMLRLSIVQRFVNLTVVEGYSPSSYTTRCVSCVCLVIVQRFCQIDSCRRLFAIIIYHTLCDLCMLSLSIVQGFVSLTVVKGYSPSSYTTRCVSCVCCIVQRCVSCVCFIVQRFSQIDSCRRLFAIIIYHTLCVLFMLSLSVLQRICQIDSCRRLFAIIIYHTLCVLCMLC
ncbi:uncharacterized protein LOC100575507 [Acyrthosiphon pisum]|uniref:Uncharacterized protein n=1 Tax=Acyrthosiphon pisum TaxID=7029 RepID=A0A8R2H546_ACYPI|nr:uncharacterized protein LOC100575507 [Acyrthosiphon pisum]|eukprot:XP_016656286.1 PREDICTED: uncharacterized protein LOC100575507 [Acyrthosiphon pisum]